MEAERPRFISRGTILAVVATTVPGILQAVAAADGALVFVLSALGVIVLAVSTAGIWWAEQKPGLNELAGVLALYGAAVCSMMWLSTGRAFLVTMPFVSMLVLYLSARTALLLNLGLIAFSGPCVWPLVETPKQLAFGVAGFASSVAFVFVFSLIARRERYARRDVERLAKEVEALATARERNRIAREIHDSLGHYLTVANVQIEAARASPDGRDERLAKVQHLLRDGLTELRSSVSLLREEVPKPFAQALDGLVAEANATGLTAALKTSGEARPLPADVSFTLFRAAQEALTNVRRHARAKSVSVLLQYGPERVKLDVHDDGVGSASAPAKGNGLKGLEERIAQVGGTLAVHAPPSGGFQLSVEVPA